MAQPGGPGGSFATPAAALGVPGAGRIDAALAAAIFRRRDAHASLRASNAGGWRSDRDILDWGGPELGGVIELARCVAAQLTADRTGAPIRPAWRVPAWADVEAAGRADVAHCHAGAFWSGTCCVEVVEAGGPEEGEEG